MPLCPYCGKCHNHKNTRKISIYELAKQPQNKGMHYNTARRIMVDFGYSASTTELDANVWCGADLTPYRRQGGH